MLGSDFNLSAIEKKSFVREVTGVKGQPVCPVKCPFLALEFRTQTMFRMFCVGLNRKGSTLHLQIPETAETLPRTLLNGSMRKRQVFADGAGRGVEREALCERNACRDGRPERTGHARPAVRKRAKLQARGPAEGGEGRTLGE